MLAAGPVGYRGIHIQYIVYILLGVGIDLPCQRPKRHRAIHATPNPSRHPQLQSILASLSRIGVRLFASLTFGTPFFVFRPLSLFLATITGTLDLVTR